MRVSLLSHMFFSSYEHYFNARLTVITCTITSVRAATSSHIEEMIEELVQSGDLEVPTTGTVPVGTTTMIGEPSSPSSLPKDLPSSVPQLDKRIKIPNILSLSLLLLTWLL